MFAPRYFAPRLFAERYFPAGGGAAPSPTPTPVFHDMGRHWYKRPEKIYWLGWMSSFLLFLRGH